jgi:hypothetical protein
MRFLPRWAPRAKVNESVGRRLRFSRFKRLPGIYRVGERKPPDPSLEPQRLTLYLPVKALDRAEEQARRAGIDTIQEYCEQLLERAIDLEHAREMMAVAEAKRGPMEGLDAVANDPDYLREWTTLAASRVRRAPAQEEPTKMSAADSESAPGETASQPPSAPAATPPGSSLAAAIILRHAALVGNDPSAFLPTLRRGEAIHATAAQELIRALGELEVEHRDATTLDRRLAYALHRLAFEGQVLITDAWPGTVRDESTIDILRIVQEAVDRVLSGEDIRYFAREASPEGLH